MPPPTNPTADDSALRERITRRLHEVTRALEPKPRPEIRRQPAPLALFPLRLEYRVIDTGRPVVRARFTAESLRADGADGTEPPVPGRSAARAVRHLEFLDEVPARRELWWRWFPDDPFAAQGTPPITAAESAAVNRFRAAIGSAAWWDVTQAQVRAAFDALARAVGAWRALYLLRVPQGGDANWETAIGRLAVLPQRVALYAAEGDQLTQLGVGEPIPEALRLSPAQLRPGGWLVDFPAAVGQGMGMRVDEPNLVAAALRADWIVAIGLTDSDVSAQLDMFLTDALANGNVEFVPPGTPTNRVSGQPPLYEREPTDAAALLARATERERSPSTTIPTDGRRLSLALGLDPRVLDSAPGSQGLEIERAKAMARVLSPGLTDELFRKLPQLSAQRESLLDFLCEHASSRGPFSPMRFGHTPYGILPMAPLVRIRAPETATADQRNAFQFCSQVASGSYAWLSGEAAQLPILRPDDPAAHEKLDEVLQLYPVSLKAVVRNLPGTRTLILSCPLARGSGYEPQVYLRQLADRPLAELANPDERDTTAPLLYRLVRFSREVLQQSPPGPDLNTRGRIHKSKLDLAGAVPGRGSAAAAHLAEAAYMLADVPDAALERLMLEVLDLLDHRADAWFTALTMCRLRALRAAQPRGLRAGWYGFLGRLRPQADRSTDGFIQAPSVAQAITAGMLRAASLRHPGSAFEIDLSSRRARQAVRLLDALRQGATLGQALGNAAARQLHDEGQDFVLHLLRSAYAVTGHAAPGASSPLDGLSLHDDASLASLQASALFNDLTPAERVRTLDQARRTRQHIAEVLDGLADLVVAEAAHQLTLGNAGAANAWMQVLSGDPPPHELIFLRTPRDGQGSTYRWALVREPRAAAGSNPRALIEPTVAALASELLTGFDAAGVDVSLAAADGSAVHRTFLLQELGMEPIDLVIGGESEVRLRARFALWREWRTNPALQASLGLPPIRDAVDQLSQRPLELDAGISVNGAPTLETLLRRCASLVDLLATSRALRPQDLAVAAAPGGAVESVDIAAVVQGAALALVSRCSVLEARLVAVEGALQTSASAVAVQAQHVVLERAQSGDDSPSTRHALTVLAQRQNDIEAALEACSFFALPEALHPFGTEDLISNPIAFERLTTRLLEQLARRRHDLASARVAAQTLSSQTLPPWQACVDRLCRALRDAGDGDALAVWPAFARDAALTPQVETSGDVAAAAVSLARVRPRLAVVPAVAERLGGLFAHRARPLPPAPAADEPPPTRDDLERPPSTHESVFIGAADVFSRPRVCGVVIDEWSDERPSRRQVTGLALHYDAPQSESPKALILGVSASDDQADWDLDAAAEIVRETIRWTLVRSLPASRSSLSRVVAPLFSVVGPVIDADTPPRRRVPAGRARWLVEGIAGSGVVMERVIGVPDEDLSARGQRPPGSA